jgi:hypothetical protein
LDALSGLSLYSSNLIRTMNGSLHEAEDLVRRLPDVIDCQIRTDEAGNVLDVQVTTGGKRPLDDVRAEALASLATRAGLDILEEQVAVVVAPPPPPRAPEEEPELEELEVQWRPRLVAVRTSVDDEQSVVEAELALGNDSAVGRAATRGAASAPDLLAQACLDALEKLSGARVVFRLLASRRTAVGDEDVVTVIVQESRGRETRTHVGAAPLGDDPSRATAYAALAALNRRFGRILTFPPRTYRIE